MKKYKAKLNTKNDLFVTGEHLLRMDVSNALQAKNFFVAANNYAVQLTTDKKYLSKISSFAYQSPALDTEYLEKTLADTQARIASSMSSITIPSGLSDSIFRASHTLNMDMLESGLATVVGFAQAINESPLLQSLPHEGVFFPWDDMPKLSGSKKNLIPFNEKLHDIHIDGIITAFPDVIKEIPARKAEAIEIIDLILSSDASDDNTMVTAKVGEIKKAFGLVNKSVQYAEKQKTGLSLPSPQDPSPTEEVVIGPLVYRADGVFIFKDKPLKMRPQMRTLCVLFMHHHRRLIDYTKIKEEIISPQKQRHTTSATITKYVNELHNLLRVHFKKEVIFNHEREGYFFDTER